MNDINVLDEISAYINKAIPCLENSVNMWLKAHPEIIARLKSWDWQSDFSYLENSLSALYAQVSVTHDDIAMLAFSWDSHYHSSVNVYFSATNEYSEWMSEDWLHHEIDLSAMSKHIFEGAEHWTEELGDDIEFFQWLFYGMVELAVLNLRKTTAFKALIKNHDYLLLSSPSEEDEFSILFDTNKASPFEFYFPGVEALTEQDLPQDSILLLGEAYHVSSKCIRSAQTRCGALPEQVGLLTELEQAHLRYEYLNALPDSFFNLTKLIELDLAYNKFENINAKISQLLNLTSLHLSHNQLAMLPNAITSLLALTTLHLGYNKLTLLPGTFAAMKQLDFLALNDNNLTNLPALPTQLSWLNLSSNKLESLPRSFTKLKKLKTLVISNNMFSTVPDEVFELTSLQSIELGGNQIQDLPIALLSLPSLTEIRVYPNLFSIEKRKALKAIFGSILFVGYDTDKKSFM